jgi:hypothetical protein
MGGFGAVPWVNRSGRRCVFPRAVVICAGIVGVMSSLPAGNLQASLVTSSPRTSIPGTHCVVFPSNNVWNTNISKLPVHPRSSSWLRSMKASSSLLHPDFGRRPYGMPFKVVGNAHPKVRITFQYRSESDPGPYPFGPDIPLELGSDRHALMINKDTCTLYELFAADWNAGRPRAGSGAVFRLGSNRLRPNWWTSADAAGLPIFAGLVRYDEVTWGVITHAIRFTAANTDCKHIWPARHDAGTCNRNYPPMGARFRLKAGYDISRFSRPVRVILLAMKKYGLVLADNGSNWYFGGTMDKRWTDAILDQLKRVPASAFQAVDELACRVDRNSGAANCP